MKTLLKILGITTGLVMSCEPIEFPQIGLGFAHPMPDTTTKLDTTNYDSIYKDTIISYPDSIYQDTIIPIDTIPIDTLINPDPVIEEPIIEEPIIEEPEPVYEPITRDKNIFLTLYDKDYQVGDLFDYAFEIYNLKEDDLTLRNYEGDRAIYLKMFCNGNIISDESLEEDFTLTLKENGYFGVRKKLDAVELIVSGVSATFDRSYNIPYPLELTITTWAKNQFFEESGEYHVEFDLKYDKGNKTIESKFYSEKFEVFE